MRESLGILILQLVFCLINFYLARGLGPSVMADEWVYSTFSRLLPLREARDPGLLFLGLMGATRACGSNFLNCGRGINTAVWSFSLPLVFLICRQLRMSKRTSLVLGLTVLVGPLSIYTVLFMPETFFLIGYLVVALLLSREDALKPLIMFAVGLSTACLSLIKFHGIFVLLGTSMTLLIAAVRRENRGSRRDLLRGFLVLMSAFLASRLVITIGLVGKPVLSPFSGRYSDEANRISLGSLSHLARPSLTSLSGNLRAVILCGGVLIPLVYFASRQNKDRYLLKLFAITQFSLMILVASVFTAHFQFGGPYESILRIHARYYQGAYVVVLLIGIHVLIDDRLSRRRANATSLVCVALLALAGLVGNKEWIASFVDNPLLLIGLKFPIFAVSVIVVASLASLFQLMKPQLFIGFFAAVSLIGTFIAQESLRENTATSSYQQAGQYVYREMKDTIGQVVFAGPDIGGLYRAWFYADSPLATIVESDPVYYGVRDLFVPWRPWVVQIGTPQGGAGQTYQVTYVPRNNEVSLVGFDETELHGGVSLQRDDARSVSDQSAHYQVTTNFKFSLPRIFRVRLEGRFRNVRSFSIKVCGKTVNVKVGDLRSRKLSTSLLKCDLDNEESKTFEVSAYLRNARSNWSKSLLTTIAIEAQSPDWLPAN